MSIFWKKNSKRTKRSDADVAITLADKLIQYEIAKIRRNANGDPVPVYNKFGITVAEEPPSVPVPYNESEEYFNDRVRGNMKNAKHTDLTYPTPNAAAISTKKS